MSDCNMADSFTRWLSGPGMHRCTFDFAPLISFYLRGTSNRLCRSVQESKYQGTVSSNRDVLNWAMYDPYYIRRWADEQSPVNRTDRSKIPAKFLRNISTWCINEILEGLNFEIFELGSVPNNLQVLNHRSRRSKYKKEVRFKVLYEELPKECWRS